MKHAGWTAQLLEIVEARAVGEARVLAARVGAMLTGLIRRLGQPPG